MPELPTPAKNLSSQGIYWEFGEIKLLNSEDIAILKELGLSLVQAKACCALFHCDKLTIKALSKRSQVPRTDLYRIMRELERRGLVERLIDTPTKFRAAPVDRCVDILIQNRFDEELKLRNKSEALKKRFRMKRKDYIIEQTNSFVRFAGSRVQERVRSSIERAQKSVRLLLSSRQLSSGVLSLAETVENSVSRGIAWQVLIEKPEKGKAVSKQVEGLAEKPNFNIKFIAQAPRTVMAVYDQKEVFIFENPTDELHHSATLWSDNKSLVALAADSFEMMWSSAIEEEKISAT